MAETDTIFSSTVKYTGIFSFKDFYNFCYDWLTEETGLGVEEVKYVEKLAGDSKKIEVVWNGAKNFTDYFRFVAKVGIKVSGLKNVEITKGSAKEQTNQGSIQIKITGILERDFDGKFEKGAFRKFTRGIYEKWVITSRIQEFEDKIAGNCDDFLGQAKAYLDLEGKR